MVLNEPLALGSNESGYYVAVFTCWWFSILFHIIFALLANRRRAAFAVWSITNKTVCEICGEKLFLKHYQCTHKHTWSTFTRTQPHCMHTYIYLYIFVKYWHLWIAIIWYLPALLELRPAICTFDNWKGASAFLRMEYKLIGITMYRMWTNCILYQLTSKLLVWF